VTRRNGAASAVLTPEEADAARLRTLSDDELRTESESRMLAVEAANPPGAGYVAHETYFADGRFRRAIEEQWRREAEWA
jgi:hypothetical protein